MEASASLLSAPLRASLGDEIAQRLRIAILNGKFGPGERLREEQLALTLGVSRGPIREALSQLEHEGLVVIRPNRGAFVARLSREDVDEVYSLRLAIERLALQRALVNAETQHLVAMQTTLDMMAIFIQRGITEQEAAELDVQFHDLIYKASGHHRLYECWANLRPQIHILLLSRNVADSNFRNVTITGHQAILDAIRNRDERLAMSVLEEHLHDAYERVIKSYGAQALPDEERASAGDMLPI